MDVLYSFLRFLGLLDEPPPLRKILKRNRVCDDFSSDDELPLIDCRQVKRLRSSDKATNNNDDKNSRRSNSVRNVPVPVKWSYTTSTPNESPNRTVPAILPEFSRHGLTTPLRKTASVKPVIDAEVLEHNEPTVGSQLENTPTKPSIVHVDLDEDDSDDNQQDDDVVFVKDVITPPTSSREYFLGSKVLDAIMLDETLEYQELLRRIATPIKPVSKAKLVAESKLEDATSELNSALNAGGQTNVAKEDDPVRVSSSDSSDSDVEVVTPESSKTSSIKKDFKRKSKQWLLELYSKYNKVPKIDEENNAARASRVSDTTSKVNNNQNIARTTSADKMDTLQVLRSKLSSEYNINQSHNKPETQKMQEQLNDCHKMADFRPNGNNERNETRYSRPENINDWLAKLDEKYFSTPKPTEKGNDMQPNKAQSYIPGIAGDWLSKLESKYKTDQLKSQEKLSDAVQMPVIVSKLNTELSPRNKWLSRLEAEYFSSPQKTQQNLILNNARHDSNIVPKVNNEQNDVYIVESNYEKDVPDTRDQLDGALRECYIPKERSETNCARSYLPATARDWLSKLDGQYKTASKNQEDLNKARQALKNISKVNGEPSKPRSTKLDSTDDCLIELKSRYNEMQQKALNDVSLASDMIPKINREENEALSHRPETMAERPSKISKLDSEHETEKPKTQMETDHMQEVTNLSKVNSERNEAHSLKFNTSEDLMVQLGSLYKNYQQEKSNNSSEQNRKSKGDDSDIEEQPNMDFELTALTPAQEKIVELGLEPGPEDEILVEKFNMKIHRLDMQTLADTFWLNDAVINFYMNLIMQRSQERQDLPKVYATNSFFYPKLMQSGQDGLRRWTRKVDIFAYDLFMVPVNIGNHWCLSIVDFRTHVIKYLDSQRVPNLECLDALLQYLTDEHKDKKGAPFDLSDWLTECPTDIPQQKNGSDCGMFACTFAEFSSRDAAYSFTQAHMPYLRRKAALEILTGKLLL